MLNDKHIDQHAGYLIEEIPNGRHIIETMPKELWEVMIEMYKKGYQDCLNDKK